MNKPSFSIIWQRIQDHEGEAFFTKRGLQFSYALEGDMLYPSRTDWNIFDILPSLKDLGFWDHQSAAD